MKLRNALSLLIVSATLILPDFATLVAQAQDDEEAPAPQLPSAAARRLSPAINRAAQRAIAQRRDAEDGDDEEDGSPASARRPRLADRARAGRTGPTADPDSTPGNLTEFETGIDFQPTPPGTRVTFNLEDADLPDLVRLISNITGRRFILPAKARNIKATIFAPTKVTAREAYRAFLAVLEMNGLTVVPSGRYLKIVETTGTEGQTTPIYSADQNAPADERFITRLHQLESVSADDVSNLLGRFKSAAGNIVAYAPTNTLIITDTGTNIRRMLQIVEQIDIGRTGEQIWIEPVHHADATEMASRLQEIFPTATGGSDGATPARPRRSAAAARTAGNKSGSSAPATIGARSGDSRLTKILPDERTNSLIILATERAYLRILEMLRHLDVPLEGEGRIHVHPIQHGDAEDVASTLSSLIGGGSGGGRAPARRPGGGGAAAAAAGGADIFEGDIRVTAHKPTNSLVITSSLHDYAALRRVLDRIDAPRKQVFIEAVVMELNVNRSRSLGLRFHGGVPDPAGEGSLGLFGFQPVESITLGGDSLSGLAVGVRGPTLDQFTQSGSFSAVGASIPSFGVALNALATSGDANVLSTPHIIAMDNVEAEISVGQNVPLQTNATSALGGLGLGSLLGGGGAAGGAGAAGLAGLAGGLAGGFGAAPRQDVGTTIRITPHINDSDEIRLEIQEEISEVGASNQGTLGTATINKRTAKTELVVNDQRTVVIGGLMRDTVNYQSTKVPILGDIPLIGNLFRQTSRQTQKTNLLLFLTPHIIRDESDLRAIYERKMRERQEFIDRYMVFGNADYEPPLDYSRTNGLLAEIFSELGVVAEERELAEAMANEPPREHRPRPPVGSYEGPHDEGDQIIEPEDSGADAPPMQEPSAAVEAEMGGGGGGEDE